MSPLERPHDIVIPMSETDAINLLCSPEIYGPRLVSVGEFTPHTVIDEWLPDKRSSATMYGQTKTEVDGAEYPTQILINFPGAIRRALARRRQQEVGAMVYVSIP